jgi:hypothetical protein
MAALDDSLHSGIASTDGPGSNVSGSWEGDRSFQTSVKKQSLIPQRLFLCFRRGSEEEPSSFQRFSGTPRVSSRKSWRRGGRNANADADVDSQHRFGPIGRSLHKFSHHFRWIRRGSGPLPLPPGCPPSLSDVEPEPAPEETKEDSSTASSSAEATATEAAPAEKAESSTAPSAAESRRLTSRMTEHQGRGLFCPHRARGTRTERSLDTSLSALDASTEGLAAYQSFLDTAQRWVAEDSDLNSDLVAAIRIGLRPKANTL